MIDNAVKQIEKWIADIEKSMGDRTKAKGGNLNLFYKGYVSGLEDALGILIEKKNEFLKEMKNR